MSVRFQSVAWSHRPWDQANSGGTHSGASPQMQAESKKAWACALGTKSVNSFAISAISGKDFFPHTYNCFCKKNSLFMSHEIYPLTSCVPLPLFFPDWSIEPVWVNRSSGWLQNCYAQPFQQAQIVTIEVNGTFCDILQVTIIMG